MENPYSLLLQPLRIGPVTAPNRFYQVPHCNGFGFPLVAEEVKSVAMEEFRKMG